MHLPVRRFALLCALFLPAPALAVPPLPDGSAIAFEDQFEGAALDGSKWRHRLLGPRRHGVTVEDAVSVGDGHLTITTYTEDGIHYSGMIGTQETFLQAYGYWEARIDFSDVPGMWSAFWIQSPTHGNPLGEPETAGVEVDIIEHHQEAAGNDTSNRAISFVIWDGYGPQTQTRLNVSDDLGLDDGFHVYGLRWSPSAWEFFVDDELIWTVTTPISRVPQFAVLSSEVEEGILSGFLPPGGLPGREESNVEMVVDWVRVWSTPLPPEPVPVPALGSMLPMMLAFLAAGAWLLVRIERDRSRRLRRACGR